ncbi:putative methyltransferase NSUN7, partial [Bacillus rossius redtenbacheri]|uniref:putative methyltransferase NSUN7 n=1 Tax=Bacillus rossius redtenbacheri TaxID=93214 RepID=UPI002FDD27C9
GPAPTAWSCSDLSKAARLLATPRRQASFHDEEEMRRVYSLIYDVFRYKNILNQALINVAFFVKYPQFQERANHVWLLLYDLYNRGFADVQDKAVRQRLFADCGLTDVDCCLTQQQVRLGAAIARIRIKNNALKLSQLLPTHLRDEKVVALDEAPVTGWVNSFLATCEDVGELVERAGLRPSCGRHGCPEECEYRWDHVCPGFLACHPAQRVALAQSELVRQCHVVLQDRAFCLGSAALARIVADLQLSGTVVQTHINSPRTTAYLACLLHCNDRIDTLLAFGAGDRKQEYEEYLQQLDVRNAVVYAERFVDTTADLLPRLEGVCAVLASPPNTYSGVVDPVDLVCSRGGDLAMLEVLADPESGSRDCVNSILQEQRHTLQLSMSQPQVQVVLYETHSIVAAENCDMVARLVAEMNDAARWRHVEEWESEDSPPPRPEDVVLPDCDLFQLGELPDVCGECFRLDDEGCYLALIRRKEITRLDAKYMIKMAEMRGLFGGGERGAKRSTASGRAQRKKTRGDDEDEDRRPRRSGRRGKVQLERLCAPTHASMMRQTLCQRAEACCGRHHQVRRDARRWWREAALYALGSREQPLRLSRTSVRRRPPFPVHVCVVDMGQCAC